MYRLNLETLPSIPLLQPFSPRSNMRSRLMSRAADVRTFPSSSQPLLHPYIHHPSSRTLLLSNHIQTSTRVTPNLSTTFIKRPHSTKPALPKSPTMASSSSSSPLQKPLKLALIQLASGADKSINLSRARDKILEAASAGANLVVLPECFNSPYGCDYFPTYAESLGDISTFTSPTSTSTSTSFIPPSKTTSPSYHALSNAARDAQVYLIGGSIPELVVPNSKSTVDDNNNNNSNVNVKGEGEEGGGDKVRYYNTLLFFSPTGELITYHRKLHLFDIDIPDGITFRESDVLSPGSKITIAHMPEYGNIMLGICYDIRFPEPALIAARENHCFALVYPGAFNLTTGPLHWRLLGRSRAVDNQLYVAMCSPARDMTAGGYHAWGHSLVADPMANVLVEADEKEMIVYVDLNPDDIVAARKGIPTGSQRRFDVYPDITNNVNG